MEKADQFIPPENFNYFLKTVGSYTIATEFASIAEATFDDFYCR
jgi:hypothetical protein